jgi:hypothetical protein
MPAPVPLYQAIEQQIRQITQPTGLRVTAVRRLALLVTGLIAARSSVLSPVAAEVFALGLTRATSAESIARRLRRTLADPRLTAATCYQAVVRQVIDWPTVLAGNTPLVLAVDESSKEDQVHLRRVSLPYRGSSLPLAWAVWRQNQPLPAGQYWHHIDQVLAAVATILPAGLPVVVTADRAYDVPAFIDRVAAHGWHWVVRCKANGSLRFQDAAGQEQAPRDQVRAHLPAPGRCWKARGAVFKAAGWRAASVVGQWAPGQAEPLVVLTDLPPVWRVLRAYDRRFWIEPGFRQDKAKGWQWEASQVRDVAHQERLVLGMAWASLVMLCGGAQVAQEQVAAQQARATGPRRPPPPAPGRARPWRPSHARASLFTLGVRRARQWLYQTIMPQAIWHLPDLDAMSWTSQWQRLQWWQRMQQTVRP